MPGTIKDDGGSICEVAAKPEPEDHLWLGTDIADCNVVAKYMRLKKFID